jgi:hypothetical protein
VFIKDFKKAFFCGTGVLTTPAVIFIFLSRVPHLYPGWPRLWPSYLFFLLNWNDRRVLPYPAFYWLSWGLMNFFPGLASNFDLPDLCLLSS